ncbi:MAG: electron transport complex subunit RsxC [Bacteroidales bacterium]|nr:electron transport complex subunit RsxC [Bacteroidales bacterium]
MKTFKIGGIHPKENKLSAGKKIEPTPIPEMVYIPMSQHIGAPAKPIVAVGDTVKAGTKIGESSGFVSANIFSSISGTVEKIDNIADASGFKKQTVIIKSDGTDTWEETIDRSTDLIKSTNLTPDEIKAKIIEAGIVGMGGATFPLGVKLSPPKDVTITHILVNGVECEPYLTADHSLMLEKAEEICVGVELLKKVLGINTAIIGIENNKPDAIEKMQNAASAYTGTQVVPLKVKYPQGSEKHLIQALIGVEVPSRKLPASVGVIVSNVASVFAVYEAVMKNKPLFERVVTVTGTSVKNPSNFLVRLGTRTGDLFPLVGGIPEDTDKIISGGPMMGKSISSVEIPITKGSSGVVCMTENEAHRKKEQNCIRCGRCVEACPIGLEPYLLNTLAKKSMIPELLEHNITECIACGSCSFSCPANKPLLDYIRLGKAKAIQATMEKK